MSVPTSPLFPIWLRAVPTYHHLPSPVLRTCDRDRSRSPSPVGRRPCTRGGSSAARPAPARCDAHLLSCPCTARPSPSPPVRIPSPLRPRRHYARKHTVPQQRHDLARLCRDSHGDGGTDEFFTFSPASVVRLRHGPFPPIDGSVSFFLFCLLNFCCFAECGILVVMLWKHGALAGHYTSSRY